MSRIYVILCVLTSRCFDVIGQARASPVVTHQGVTAAVASVTSTAAGYAPAAPPNVPTLSLSAVPRVASSVTSSAVLPSITPITPTSTIEGLQGADCSQTSDCAEGFVCRSNTCDCPVGFSYNPLTRICQDGCLVYGSGFSYQERWCIFGYNSRKYMGLGSAERCAELCVNAESFVCVSFEMDEDNCYLQEVSQLDVPTSTFVSLGNCDSYQRHCANN